MNTIDQALSSSSTAGMALRRVLLLFIVTLFYCDIAIYLSLAVSSRLEPQYWIGLLVVLTGVLAWFSPRTRWEVFRTPVFFWCVLFLALTLIFCVAVPTSHVEQLKERIRDVVLLTSFLAVFLMLPRQLGFLKKLVVLAVVLGVLLNLMSFSYPDFLRPPHVVGKYRPGGLYINPNESAAALVLGMLISVGVVPRRWREVYTLLVIIAVGATFSREGVLGWVVVVIGLCVTKFLAWRKLAAGVVVLFVCVVVLAFAVANLHIVGHDMVIYYHYNAERFVGLFNGNAYFGEYTQRLKLLDAGWALFLTHPFIGNGIGSTYHWSLAASTHNMYLLYADDYGVIGFLLYPLLMWCMIWKATGETRKLACVMAMFLLFWGLFDHNIVQNYYSLFAISLTAAMSWISATENVQHSQANPAETASD